MRLLNKTDIADDLDAQATSLSKIQAETVTDLDNKKVPTYFSVTHSYFT